MERKMDDRTLVDRLAEALAMMRGGGRAVNDIDWYRCRRDARRTLAELRCATRL